jgi:ketosteroid isomerase-like protein
VLEELGVKRCSNRRERSVVVRYVFRGPGAPKEEVMPGETNIQRLQQAYEGFAGRDLEAVLAVMSPDIEWDASDALAHTGMYHGHEGVIEYLRGLSGVWEDFELEPDQYVEAPGGGSIMVLGVTRGRLAETGEHVEARFAHIGEVKDGKIVRIKICLDRAAAERTLQKESNSVARS